MYQSSSGVLVMGLKSCLQLLVICVSMDELYILSAAPAKSRQSCPTLCNPIDSSPSGSSGPGILQAGILEWVAISFSSTCMLSHFSHVQLCATPWTAAHQAPLSTGFSRQEYWIGLPFPSPYIFSLGLSFLIYKVETNLMGK